VDYVKQKVLADATFSGRPTIRQLPVFDFQVALPLSLHFNVPLTIIGTERLDNLRLTSEAKTVYKEALDLPESAHHFLDNSFGSLTQKMSSRLRKDALPGKAYAPF